MQGLRRAGELEVGVDLAEHGRSAIRYRHRITIANWWGVVRHLDEHGHVQGAVEQLRARVVLLRAPVVHLAHLGSFHKRGTEYDVFGLI